MSAAIWKFPLRIGLTVAQMPLGAKVLHVHEQNGMPCLWALVDPAKPTQERRFVTEGTGHSLDTECTPFRYIGTAHCHGFVWHAFEVPVVPGVSP